jgi:hypothetical protein
MKRSALARVALAAVLALPFIGLAESTAGACENGVRIAVDTETPRIARAEKALNEGQFTLAAVGVLQVFPHIRSAPAANGSLTSRALRIMALASVRTDGALTAGDAWRGTTAEEKSANVEWAITTLRALNKLRAKSPSLQTDLGEALAKVSKHHDEALKLLGGLADKDLITSAHGYAALAKLRETAGDKTGRDAAMKRCEAMAKSPGVCRGSAAPSV